MKLFDPSLRFYKGNLHTHTTNSDGRATPEECMRLYKEHGYDFLALTDHWFVEKEQTYQGMLILPGAEYDFTFPTQVLHILCLFPDKKLSEGIARGITHQEIIARVNGVGGVVICAHPAWSLNTNEFLQSLDGVEIAEIYNSMSAEPYNSPRANSEGILDVAAANGKLFNLCAADDTHYYQGEQCQSYTMLQAEELSVPAILDALRKGRFYASQGPEFKNIERIGDEIAVETSPVSLITFCSNKCWIPGRSSQGDGLTEKVYKIQPGEKYVRVQITAADGKKAWSSPIPV